MKINIGFLPAQYSTEEQIKILDLFTKKIPEKHLVAGNVVQHGIAIFQIVTIRLNIETGETYAEFIQTSNRSNLIVTKPGVKPS